MTAASDAAPDRVEDPDTPYDPNDEAAVNAFWENAEVRMPKTRGKRGRVFSPFAEIRTEFTLKGDRHAIAA